MSKQFLIQVLALIEFLTVDAYSTSSYMLGSIEHVLEMNDPKEIDPIQFRKKHYFNDALGNMIEMLDQKPDRFLSPFIIQQHIALIHVLLTIFDHDIKNIRPLKLFDSDLHFGSCFFKPIQSDTFLTREKREKIVSERMDFIDKLKTLSLESSEKLEILLRRSPPDSAVS